MRRVLPLYLLLLPALASADGPASPLFRAACTSVAAISQMASTQLVAGVAGQKVYVCALFVQNAGTAQNISLVEGTGTVCATGKAALIGGTTASVSLAVNSGFALANSPPFLRTITAGDSLCLLQSGNTNISGFLSYASSP